MLQVQTSTQVLGQFIRGEKSEQKCCLIQMFEDLIIPKRIQDNNVNPNRATTQSCHHTAGLRLENA